MSILWLVLSIIINFATLDSMSIFLRHPSDQQVADDLI